MISDIPFIESLKVLCISGCSSMNNISDAYCKSGLKNLTITYNEKIDTIPVINRLQVLDCSSSPKIQKIPHLDGLVSLNCSYGDPNIKIPSTLSKLKYLQCSRHFGFGTFMSEEFYRFINNKSCHCDIPPIKGLEIVVPNSIKSLESGFFCERLGSDNRKYRFFKNLHDIITIQRNWRRIRARRNKLSEKFDIYFCKNENNL